MHSDALTLMHTHTSAQAHMRAWGQVLSEICVMLKFISALYVGVSDCLALD